MRAWWLPAWARDYRREQLRADFVAGISTFVLIVPQGLGYAMLAGLPPIVGLYASLGPVLAYALLGTSRQLSVGPVAMDSLLVFVAVSGIAQAHTDHYVAAATTLALLVGGIQLLMSALRMGFVANFLSRPVMSGFTSAAALLIAATQLGNALGLAKDPGGPKNSLLSIVERVGETNPIVLAMSIVFIGSLWLLKRKPGIPATLLVVGLGTGLVFALGFEGRVPTIGNVPEGLPRLGLPRIELDSVKALLPSAFTIALVSFTEAIVTGKHFAKGQREDIKPNTELLALGMANVVGGLSGAYPVAGGLSRTAAHVAAGAKTQAATIVVAALVLLTLLFLTPLFRFVPVAALSAIILVSVVGLIDVKEPRRLWRLRRSDFGLLLWTFIATLWLGIQWGVALGISASLLLFIVRSTRPHVAVLGRIGDTEAYLNVERHPAALQAPGVLAVRIDAQFYFGNVTFLKDTLRRLEAESAHSLRAVVLDFSGVNDLDSSAEAALRELDAEYARRGMLLYFARVKGPVRDVMYRSGLLELLDRERRIFFRTHDAVQVASGVRTPEMQCDPEDARAPADRLGCALLNVGRDELPPRASDELHPRPSLV